MLKRILIGLCVVLLVLFVSNLLSVSKINTYQFSSSNNEFQFLVIPSKGRGESKLIEEFEKWKNESIDRQDQSLHRKFRKNYLKFWNWKEYRKPLYNYPYME